MRDIWLIGGMQRKSLSVTTQLQHQALWILSSCLVWCHFRRSMTQLEHSTFKFEYCLLAAKDYHCRCHVGTM